MSDDGWPKTWPGAIAFCFALLLVFIANFWPFGAIIAFIVWRVHHPEKP